MISCVFYLKNGNTWEETYRTEDEQRVYERLASVLVRKYQWKSPTIGRVEERPDYASGNRIITVYQTCGDRKAKEVYEVRI